jgi:gliding motility-associated-like protein
MKKHLLTSPFLAFLCLFLTIQTAFSQASVHGSFSQFSRTDAYINALATSNRGSLSGSVTKGQTDTQTGLSDTDLTSLVVDAGSNSSTFPSLTLQYYVSVPYETSSIFITATADPNATIGLQRDAGPVASIANGTSTAPIPIAVGVNNFQIKVTAEGGATKSYTLSVNRDVSAAFSTVSISSLRNGASIINGLTSTSIPVSFETTAVAVTAVTQDPTATFKVRINNGSLMSMVNGVVSSPLSLTTGANFLEAIVTAQDGLTVQTYAYTITRAGASEVVLTAILLGSGALSQPDPLSAHAYFTSVPYSTSSVTMTLTGAFNLSVQIQDSNSLRTISYTSTVGAVTEPIVLTTGINVLNITVIAQDGYTAKNYAVVVTREGDIADLSSNLLSSTVDPDINSYNALEGNFEVPNATNSVILTSATKDPLATFKIRLNNGNLIPMVNGVPSASLSITVGSNLLETIVTAQDGTTRTYSYTVYRSGPFDADLTALEVSSGSLSPSFSSSVLQYTVDVPYKTSSITITPTSFNNAVIYLATSLIQATPTGNGISTVPITLTAGSNFITLITGARVGIETKNYNVVVRRSFPSAALSTISMSSEDNSDFSSDGVYNYNIRTSFKTKSLKLTATTLSPEATFVVRINRGSLIPMVNGAPSSSLSLTTGDNILEVIVTGADGTTTQSYTYTINRDLGVSIANLASLDLGTALLSPGFFSSITAYNASVNYSTSTISITPTTAHHLATVSFKINSGNFTPIAKGTATPKLSLNVGINTIEFLVTSENGATKTYSIVITRNQPSADLATLSFGPDIYIGFSPSNANYNLGAPRLTGAATLTTSAVDTDATIQLKIGNGSFSTPFTKNLTTPLILAPGVNNLQILVTAPGGSPTKTYSVVIARDPGSSNSILSNLALSAGILTSPFYQSLMYNYGAVVPTTATSITITPVKSDNNSTVVAKVNGGSYAPLNGGSVTLPLSTNGAPDIVAFLVTAQNGVTTSTYTLTIGKSESTSSDADLSALSFSVPNSVVFSRGITSYDFRVENLITSLTLVPTASDPAAVIRVNSVLVASGGSSPAIQLIGTNLNTITITVTAGNGLTTKTYRVLVTRRLSLDADLAGLELSSGNLNENFSKSRYSYSAVVSNSTASITVKAITSEPNAIVKINGVYTGNTNALPVSLASGINTIAVFITSQGISVTKTYTITITRADADQAIPDQNGNVTLTNTSNQLVVSSPIQPVTVTIPAGVNNSSVDYGGLIINGTGTIPQTTINSPVASVIIPPATVVNSSTPGWDGVINSPAVTTYDLPPVQGEITTTGLVIEVGSPNHSLSFSKAVRLLLPGQVGMRVAYVHGGIYTEISTTGAEDSQLAGDALPENGAFKINSGADLVIWTKAFSRFITFSQSTDLNVALVATDKEWLNESMIKGANNDLNSIVTQLTDPLPSIGSAGSTITWISDNPSIVSSDGKMVIRPVLGSGNAVVTLTATIKKGLITDTKSFTLTVIETPNQTPTLAAIADLKICYSGTAQIVLVQGISAGSEANQSISFSINSSNQSLLNQLTISGSGSTRMLSFVPANSLGGSTTITIIIRDNGGIANGAVDTYSRSFIVTVNPLPVIEIKSSLLTVGKGSTAELTASGGISYVWTGSAGIVSGQNSATLIVRPSQTTSYTVIATTALGCTATKSITVPVTNDYSLVKGANIMTPNGDGQNDALMIKNIDLYPNNTLKIYDRSGRLIYTKQNYNNDWQGTVDGLPLAADTYYYVLDFGKDNPPIKGYVSIVRRK